MSLLLGFCGKSQDLMAEYRENLQTLAMVDESGVGSKDDHEKLFTKMEIQVTDISNNMSILMAALESKFGPVNDFGRSNSYIGSKGKLEDKDNP